MRTLREAPEITGDLDKGKRKAGYDRWGRKKERGHHGIRESAEDRRKWIYEGDESSLFLSKSHCFINLDPKLFKGFLE